MKIVSNILLTLSLLCFVGLIWMTEFWWQWLLTSAVLLFAGAYYYAEDDKSTD